MKMISVDARYVRCLVRVLTNDTCKRILISKILLTQNSAMKTASTAGTPSKGDLIFHIRCATRKRLYRKSSMLFMKERDSC
jgi:hypothetical protein